MSKPINFICFVLTPNHSQIVVHRLQNVALILIPIFLGGCGSEEGRSRSIGTSPNPNIAPTINPTFNYLGVARYIGQSQCHSDLKSYFKFFGG